MSRRVSGEAAPELTGRVVAVTGGASGIGRAIVLEAVARGARVAVIDRDSAAVAKLSEELGAGAGDGSLLVAGDVTSESDIASWFASIADAGGAYALVNNVGGALAYRDFKDLDVGEFDRTLDLNLRSAFICSQAAVDQMLAAGEGRIVNITSIAAGRAIPAISAYSVSKAALLALTRSMAIELAPSEIMVNAVSPGHILTDASLRVVPSEILEARGAIIPTGDMGRAEDVARTVIFLIGDSTFLTGAEIMVDGGISAAMPRPPAA